MRSLIAPAAVVLAAFAVAAPAAAQTPEREIVDNAKRQGIVGEQADGYLGLVSTAAVDVRAAVGEINEGRRRVYEQAAARTGVSVEAAGQAAGRQLIERVPAGQFYRSVDGAWRRK